MVDQEKYMLASFNVGYHQPKQHALCGNRSPESDIKCVHLIESSIFHTLLHSMSINGRSLPSKIEERTQIVVPQFGLSINCQVLSMQAPSSAPSSHLLVPCHPFQKRRSWQGEKWVHAKVPMNTQLGQLCINFCSLNTVYCAVTIQWISCLLYFILQKLP